MRSLCPICLTDRLWHVQLLDQEGQQSSNKTAGLDAFQKTKEGTKRTEVNEKETRSRHSFALFSLCTLGNWRHPNGEKGDSNLTLHAIPWKGNVCALSTQKSIFGVTLGLIWTRLHWESALEKEQCVLQPEPISKSPLQQSPSL